MNELLKKKAFSDLFPVPEYLLLSNSGIVITDTEVKFAEFRHNNFSNTLKLSHFKKFALQKETVQSGFINAPEKLISILHRIARRYKLRYVLATLPEERTYLFTTVIDKVPEEGLRDAVAFIIEENVPVKLANSVFDFDIIEELSAKEGGETNQLKITVSVISKKVVDFYLQVFELAGMTPISFDIESQAIARAVVPKGDKRAQLIVNFRHKKTDYYIIEDEIVQFTTTLPYGAEDDSSNTHIVELKAELSKILAFWGSRVEKPGLSERKIERILLCGLGALNDSLVTEFRKDCPIVCSLADAWVNVPKLEKDIPPIFLKEALDYVSAIGLLLPQKKKSYV